MKRVAGHSTHLEALAWAVTKYGGPVLELGGGWYSTPMLAGIAAATGLRVVTIEPHPGFRAALQEKWSGRVVVQAPGPDGVHPRVDEQWAVVFVDHGVAERRAESVSRYNESVRVVHDVEPRQRHRYPGLWEATHGLVVRQFTHLEPWTAVLSAG